MTGPDDASPDGAAPDDAARDDAALVRDAVLAASTTADGPDVDAYVAVFTPDAVWDMPGAPRRGHDEIRAGSLERRAAGLIGPGSNTRHVVTDVEVTLDGTTASATSHWAFEVELDRTPQVAMTGTYHDRLELTGDGWKIAHRHITVDDAPSTPTPEDRP